MGRLIFVVLVIFFTLFNIFGAFGATSPSTSSTVLSITYIDTDDTIFFNNKAYLPARRLGEILGSNIKWYQKEKLFVLAANGVFSAFSSQNLLTVVKINDTFNKITSDRILRQNTMYLSIDTLKLLQLEYDSSTVPYKVYGNIRQHVYEKDLDAFAAKAASMLEESKPKEISIYSTFFNAASRNRTSNIKIASQALNGVIVKPGKTFSFNKTVGPRTPERGYKTAIVFLNKKKVEAYGGGICQVSSTLYNAVLNAKLTVLQRRPHSLSVTYVPRGKDATVAYGSIDFSFKNSKPYSVVLKTEIVKNKLTISIYPANG